MEWPSFWGVSWSLQSGLHIFMACLGKIFAHSVSLDKLVASQNPLQLNAHRRAWWYSKAKKGLLKLPLWHSFALIWLSHIWGWDVRSSFYIKCVQRDFSSPHFTNFSKGMNVSGHHISATILVVTLQHCIHDCFPPPQIFSMVLGIFRIQLPLFSVVVITTLASEEMLQFPKPLIRRISIFSRALECFLFQEPRLIFLSMDLVSLGKKFLVILCLRSIDS